MRLAWIGLLAFMLAANAQTTVTRRSITAVGNSTVSGTPDKAMVDLGVSTQATTAQDASTQNAMQVSSVLSAIQTVLGAAANIKTISYSLSPVYNYPPGGGNPTLIGYTATNIVEATLTDLTLIGKVIDVAIGAGANRVQGIVFGLQNPDPIQAQALKTAATSAMALANAIAAGLGVHTGNVIRASEGVQLLTPSRSVGAAAPGATTPVEPGLIQVQGSVTVEVEII